MARRRNPPMLTARRWLSQSPPPKEEPTIPKSSLATVLAALADSHAMTEAYVATRPDILESVGLDPGWITGEVVACAARINLLTSRSILRRNGGKRTEPIPVDVHRDEIFGFDIRLIAIWMGADGWEFEEAYPVLDEFQCDLSDDCIQRYLRDGRKGTGREPAPLSPGQAETLRELSEKLRFPDRLTGSGDDNRIGNS